MLGSNTNPAWRALASSTKASAYFGRAWCSRTFQRTSTLRMCQARKLFDKIAIRLFVDSVWLHRFWGCHRFSDRCFFVQGRQFHVCSRCTGLILGAPCSLFLVPLFLVPLRGVLFLVFIAFVLALLTDGLTQLAKWRTSNNRLRFITGFGTAATFLPALLDIVGYS